MSINREFIFFSFYIFVLVANLIAAVGIYLGIAPPSILLGLKDIALFFMVIASPLVFLVPSGALVFPIVMLIYAFSILMLYVPFSNAPLIGQITAIRQFLVFWMIFAVGYFYGASTGVKHSSTFRLFVKIGVVIVVVGIFERFTHAWSVFISPFFVSKNIGVFQNGYPFVLIEPMSFFNEFSDTTGFLRMSSTFLDPINLGHACVAWYIMCLFLDDNDGSENNYFFYKCIFSLGVVLAFSKAALIQYMIIMFLSSKLLPIYVKSVLIIFVVIVGFVLMQSHEGFLIHLTGLFNSFTSATIFGYGLAEAGNVASMYSGVNVVNVGDTFIGSVLAQLGVAGLFLWSAPFFLISYFMLNKSFLLPIALLLQLVLSSLSENTFNFLSVFNLSLLCGFICSSVMLSKKPELSKQPIV